MVEGLARSLAGHGVGYRALALVARGHVLDGRGHARSDALLAHWLTVGHVRAGRQDGVDGVDVSAPGDRPGQGVATLAVVDHAVAVRQLLAVHLLELLRCSPARR